MQVAPSTQQYSKMWCGVRGNMQYHAPCPSALCHTLLSHHKLDLCIDGTKSQHNYKTDTSRSAREWKTSRKMRLCITI